MRRHLQFANDSMPGISRVMHGDTPSYHRADGRRIRGSRQLARIAALGIPPAWTEVWICPSERGHLQATGRDARRRKQYLYHRDWITERDSNKFSALTTFARVLPRIRRAVRRDLALRNLCKRRVLAAVVHLMDRACVRVGHDRYRRANGSFGLTTLRERHVRAKGAAVVLDFRGKSGKRHHIEIDDPALARVVKDCLDLPGQVLFQYEDDDGRHAIAAQDVNDYLRSCARVAVTSKDFRTWGGTVCAAAHLARVGPHVTKKELAGEVRAAIRAAAEHLGNTPAVCRRSYIHPKVLAGYQAQRRAPARRVRGLRKDEQAVLGLLGYRGHPGTGRSSRQGARVPRRAAAVTMLPAPA
jgi:DNA topoisomerase-1